MSAQQSAKSPLPDVRRVVTGHKPTGKSTIIVDQIQQPQYWSPGSLNAVYDIGRNDQVPAKLDSELTQGKWVDEVADSGHVSKTGAVFRSFDYAPGSVVPFHRTESIDYGVVTHGSIVLEMDDGERVTLNAGDALVQRGTIHWWRNESATEWARIFFVLIGAEPVAVDGKLLKEEWHVDKSDNFGGRISS